MQFLKAYATPITIVGAVFTLLAFGPQERKQKFEEIDVERINIVEKNGQLRMVISNRQRQHPGIVDGKLIPRPGGRPPGMIFFNHRGDECGGLTFGGNGGNGHFLSFTMDKSRNDQTVGMQHLESDNGRYFAGFRVWDRPNSSLADFLTKYETIKKMPDEAARNAAIKELSDKGELGARRITVGKLRDKSAMIELCDVKGKPRIRISVDAAGNPRMDFLDETGTVTYTLPEPSKVEPK
jgi:hypothetical protein